MFDIREQIKNLLTIADLMQGFDRSGLTIYKYRRHHGLPNIIITGNERDTIRFVLEEVEQWAQDHNKDFDKKRIKRFGTF